MPSWTKVGRPRGLIRFASLNNIERGERQRFTARMKLYAGILAALIALFLYLVFTRAEMETTLLRAPGALLQQTPEGKIENLYTLKVIHKTSRDLPVELKLENLAGTVRLMGAAPFSVPKEKLAQTSVLIELDPAVLTGNCTKLKLGVFSNGKRLETVATGFVGPRKRLHELHPDMELWTAFLLGVAGSLHCAGMCGPLVLALANSRPRTARESTGRIFYHAGRVASYCLLGLALGCLGHIATPAGFQRWLSITLGVALLGGLFLAARVPLAAPVVKWVTLVTRFMRELLQRHSLVSHAMMGALNGLLPCGLVYVAATGAIATAHPLTGAAFMTVFGLGTWPMMLGIQFAGGRLRLPARLPFGSVMRAAVLIMALLLILRGLELKIPFVSPELSDFGNGHEHCH